MFKLHVTVSSDNVEQFKIDCMEFGCKPLLIELQKDSTSYQQLMTSQKFNHKHWEFEIMKAKEFIGSKYPIQRIKVEINPYEYGSVGIKYYETHFRIKALSSTIDKLSELVKTNEFHKSKNIFKRISDDEFYQMATYRTYDLSLSKFELVISNFKQTLIDNGFEFDKVEVKACVIDTNDSLDINWLN